MARKPRIHYPGAFYHVILRGNAGNPVFFDDHDRSRFFLLLQEGTERFRHRIHAYCLMTNHVHLIIQAGDISLSRIIQNLSFRYTRYINSRRKQTGHLFQGRYKALLLDADCYLLQLARYIHNNPVRAKLVKGPAEYPWSSHNAYLGTITIPWLTTDFILQQFDEAKAEAIVLYNQFQLEGLGEEPRKEFHTGDFEGRILGNERFIEEVMSRESQLEKKATLTQVLHTVSEKYRLHQHDLHSRSRQGKRAEARAMAALFVRESEHLSLTDLSKELERDLSGLSQAAGRLERKMKQDSKLAEIFESIKTSLIQMPNSQA